MIGLISGKRVLILTVQKPPMKLSSVKKNNNNVDYPPIKCDNVPGSISQKFSIKTKLKTKFP